MPTTTTKETDFTNQVPIVLFDVDNQQVAMRVPFVSDGRTICGHLHNENRAVTSLRETTVKKRSTTLTAHVFRISSRRLVSFGRERTSDTKGLVFRHARFGVARRLLNVSSFSPRLLFVVLRWELFRAAGHSHVHIASWCRRSRNEKQRKR